MERIIARLTQVQSRLTEILKARDAANAKLAGHSQKVELERKTFIEQQAQALDAQLEALKADTVLQRKLTDEYWNRRISSVRNAVAKKKSAIERQLNERRTAWAEKRKEAQSRSILEHQRKLIDLDAQHARNLEILDSHGVFAQELKGRIGSFTRERGVRLDIRGMEPERAISRQAPDEPLADDPNETSKALQQRLDALENRLRASHRLGPWIPPIAAYALALIAGAGAWGWLTEFRFNFSTPLVFGVFAACAILLAVINWLMTKSKQKVFEAGFELAEESIELAGAVQREKLREKNRNMTGITTLGCERVLVENEENEKFQQQLNQFNKPLSEAQARIQAQGERLLEKLSSRKQSALQTLDRESAEKLAKMRSDNEIALTKRTEEAGAQALAAEREKSAVFENLASDWQKEVSQFASFIDEQKATFAHSHPAWNAINLKEMLLPIDFHNEVPIASLKLDLNALARADQTGPFTLKALENATLPLFLEFPLRGSLLVGYQSARRNDTLGLISSTVLNLLRSFPAGKAKLTIIDPIGLGQNFAGLMHLADYDESLVNGRIWSDGAHIERKLTELTEHMEKVIQKYLRNRYKTIEEYNREAGQMAEPYRFVVVGDFPTGFSELALERLASIVKSGVRCGVYTVLLYNEKQKLPSQIDMTLLRQNGFVVREIADGLVVDHDRLQAVRSLRLEERPTSQQVEELVNSVGKQCREAARVQVPFEIVMPKKDEYWSQVTNTSVRLPLGKAGADRLQYLELGRGTAQHALIAGKTGSGKSNLFHVIITNCASWYSPKEIEFYLIDFKKGVEFKTYGTHRLRHVRVVAVESDREFAISVLRRIDVELTHRGEMFRKARVQDLANFRKASPETVIPRTLLMIDEFQEFFVDDDAVAQEASLLLDRIVRQGRAFGIHVILGTQTLGGTYSLSKSTLGQVGVRVALACNEQDSYLILGDDNGAAALLSRPGEAIYNDMAGAVEGNNPFQAVWLPKDLQDNYLAILQRKAVEGGMDKEPVDPIVVFEGASLSDLRNNMVLRDVALQDARPVASTPRIWLGEPNAIKGPTELEFTRQAGASMLVVGHRGDREISMCCSAVISLAAAYRPQDIQIRILDGTRPDAPARDRLVQIAESLPHDIELCDYRRGADVIQELVKEMKARQEPGAPNEKHLFFMVLGLEKFRTLRQEDEYSFSSSSSDEGPSAAKGFLELLTEGPNAGIHSMIWCDTLSNLNRSISRKTLREFEMRVLFQMSQSDSSELIDSQAANRLGMYNALLFQGQSGNIEKFRPYAAPDKDLITEFAGILKAREGRLAAKVSS